MHAIIPYLLCLLVGTGAVLLTANHWAIVAFIGSIIITIVNIVLQRRNNVQLNQGKSIGSFIFFVISMFLLNCLVTFTIAFATVFIYNAL